MPSDHTPPLPLQAENTRDVLHVPGIGIARLAVRELKPEPRHRGTEVTADPSRELLTEKMLADRWACSVARLQRWRTVDEGRSRLKIVGKVLYRVKDTEAYEEASLIRKVPQDSTHEAPNGLEAVRTARHQFEMILAVQARDEHSLRPDPGVAQLRLLLVEPAARGQGLGKRLTAQCEAFAQGAGYARMRLWTHQSLVAARTIYRAAGYRLMASEVHKSFGNRQLGEVREKDLRDAGRDGGRDAVRGAGRGALESGP